MAAATLNVIVAQSSAPLHSIDHGEAGGTVDIERRPDAAVVAMSHSAGSARWHR